MAHIHIGSGTIGRGGLIGVGADLLEEMSHWGLTLRLQILKLYQVWLSSCYLRIQM